MNAPHMAAAASIAQVNDVPLNNAAEVLDLSELRQRACTELLRQAAMRAGLLPADDPLPADGVISEAASLAIEALLERELAVPEPSEAACRRHFAAHAARHAVGERVRLRHILFAVTPGVDVTALRQRAEACLIDLRARGADESGDRFAAAARTLSNCPSGADGGALGWLTVADCAPEFAREIFGQAGVGVLARLVPGAQPLRPARGRGAGTRARRPAGVRDGARRGGAIAAPDLVCHRAAAVPAGAGLRRTHRGRDARPGRHAAGAVTRRGP